jgi:hypothetical protein
MCKKFTVLKVEPQQMEKKGKHRNKVCQTLIHVLISSINEFYILRAQKPKTTEKRNKMY